MKTISVSLLRVAVAVSSDVSAPPDISPKGVSFVVTKPVPVTVIIVPPGTGPRGGDIDVIVGGV